MGGQVRKDVSAATLRNRYAELLRLRGYVQRLEQLSQADAEGSGQEYLAAIDERYADED